MNLIEEFMKEYTQLLLDHASNKLTDEEYAAAMISMASRAMGLSRRVRAAHLKALTAMIFKAVDRERLAACSLCEKPLQLICKDVTYDEADLLDLAYKARVAVHTVLTANHHEVPEEKYPSLAVAQTDGLVPRIFMKSARTGEVLYSFAIGRTKDGGLKMRDPIDAIATDYILRHEMRGSV